MLDLSDLDACCSVASCLFLASLAILNDSGRQRWSRSSHTFHMVHRLLLVLLGMVVVLYCSCMLSGSVEAFLLADVESLLLQQSP